METKHEGCWYCGSKDQEILKAVNKRIIDKSGKENYYSVAVCDGCVKASILDQRIPAEQRQ